ncbi:MAG: FeoB-associated Cys-rich membrane protein [Adhaeribacter sp.]
MIQQIIILLLFIAAAVYVGRLVYKSFTAKSGCAKGCGACATIDFNKIDKQIKASAGK